MKSFPTNRKPTASFRIVSLLLTIAQLWLMLAAANTSAQTSNAVSTSTTTTSTAPSLGDWTQYHRDNMQRWNPYETILGVNNVVDLQLKWKNSIGRDNGGIQPPVSVANGVIYFGSDGSGIFGLNAGTGALLWNFPTPDSAQISAPAVANGVLYVGGGDDNVYALSASTGAKLWSFTTGNFVLSSPAVVNGVVYVGSNDHNVYALSASTGAKLWAFATGNIVRSSPAVANGVVYVGSGDDNVYALNGTTGAKLWSFQTGDFVESSPAVANGVVYVGSYDHNVYALNASTGAKVWAFATGDGVNSSPAVANGVVYISSNDGNLYALNASTGAELWSIATGNPLYSPPVIVDGVVYIRGGFGEEPGIGEVGIVYAFSAGAGLLLRVQPTPTTVHQGDLLTFAFPVWNQGPGNADHEVLNTQVPTGTTFDYIRISGTPGLGTCTTPPYQGTGQIVCHENASMAPNTTWTVRLTVRVTAPAGTVITENAATMADNAPPNTANNTATVSLTVQ